MESNFFSFVKPFLNFIDAGEFYRKPFKWLYSLIAILSLLTPLYLLYEMISKNIFDGPAKLVIGALLIWVILAFSYWIVFQIWWSRKNQIGEHKIKGDRFVATPSFVHFIQTSGESMGTFVAIAGAGASLISFILLGSDGRVIDRMIAIRGGGDYGILGVIIFPIIGYIIVIFSRFISEQISALAAIANNTKATANNTKKD